MINLRGLQSKEPYEAKPKMCNFCSRRHAGGKKNCRIYRSINPTTNGSTCPPKRQKEVRAMSAPAQERV